MPPKKSTPSKRKQSVENPVQGYRHSDKKRKNNPPAKLAADGTVPVMPKAAYAYSPRQPPELRFDPDGTPDALPALLQAATERKLTPKEAQTLSRALRNQEPWLEWAEKQEQERTGFAVDPVALHIHERVSTQAILRVAAREDAQRDLFADPQQEYHKAVQFYRHDVDWSNRLILGDSLQVMSSLARREDLAGKVQMIYIDPPYGIRFASNFQPEVGRRDVKDKEEDLTREPEMVKAYRDTWHLGIHSYLSYLRDRLVVAKELLADSGSIFVQISDENLHRVRQVMEEVFGEENFCALIPFSKTSGQTPRLLASISDFLIWFCKESTKVKYRRLYKAREAIENPRERYICVEQENAILIDLSFNQKSGQEAIPFGRILRLRPTDSQTGGISSSFQIPFQGRSFAPPATRGWSSSEPGMRRLAQSGRMVSVGNSLTWKSYRDESKYRPITSLWNDITGTGFGASKLYVVQTLAGIIERCLLMTTEPGDLVLDPTCGSGTTASVAECWGRRWITVDTSRVAAAIARQRLLTEEFPYYKTRIVSEGLNGNPGAGFIYKTVPHITLKSIAQNENLDPIFAKWEPVLEEKLQACNTALAEVSKDLRAKLHAKLTEKQRREGRRSITDADERRWLLPPALPRRKSYTTVDKDFPGWYHWEVPFDTDPDWPKTLQKAVTDYRAAWREKQDEVDACIAANADMEELVDQPEIVRGVTRVSGPFTVEAVQPPEMSLGDVAAVIPGEFAGAPEELETFGDEDTQRPDMVLRRVEARPDLDTQNLDAYLDQMVRLLRTDGVRFPNNKQMRFSRLDAIYASGSASGLHAEGRWLPEGEEDDDPEGRAFVAIAFGPQYGPITAKQVEDSVRAANRAGYDALVMAGFSFDGPAQAVIDEAQHPNLRIHMANIRPDVNPGMDGLLKEQPGSQLFTVFGQPRSSIEPLGDGMYIAHMEGVDIYNPVDNTVRATGADKVAAWFLDTDYDGWTFCITQAFFPDRTAWKKLERALKGVIDEDAFEKLSGTESLPFALGSHKQVAVKVIDPRGNEVMQVHRVG